SQVLSSKSRATHLRGGTADRRALHSTAPDASNRRTFCQGQSFKFLTHETHRPKHGHDHFHHRNFARGQYVVAQHMERSHLPWLLYRVFRIFCTVVVFISTKYRLQ
ncbi:hypothetical protein CYMTET_10528, partial [Cymbomonas tetramitiformis]